jgi:hypothetical protein
MALVLRESLTSDREDCIREGSMRHCCQVFITIICLQRLRVLLKKGAL